MKLAFVIQFVGRLLLGFFVFLACGALMVCLLAVMLPVGSYRFLFAFHFFNLPIWFVLSLVASSVVMSAVDRWMEK